MKQIYILFFFFSSIPALLAQSYPIGNTTITFNDPARGNRAIEVDIYYPAVSAGNNAPVAGNTGEKFPLVVFGHGFVMTVSAYQNIWTALVPAGYIVALPKTEGNLFPNHTNFGKDLAFVLGALQVAGNTSGNLFFNKVAVESAIMGHSMGGGAAFLAIQYNPSISTVIGLAPAETNPAASAAAQNISIPALVFAGGNDCVTPAGQHSQLIYNNTASSCKTYISVIGGSHCQFANSNFNCSFGEATCSPGPTISRSVQQGLVMKYLLPYLHYRLRGNCAEWYNLQSSLLNDGAVTYLQSCNETLSCTSPVNRQTKNITATSAQLTWRKGTCVNNYQIRYRKSSNTAWTVQYAGKNGSFQLNSLQSGTSYDWQVRTRCDSTGTNVSNWGSLKQFTTSSLRSQDGIDVPENEISFDVNITPNPSTGFFQLSVKGKALANYQLEIVNILGTVVDRSTFISDTDLFTIPQNYTNHPSGVYFLRLSDGHHVVTKRIVIQ